MRIDAHLMRIDAHQQKLAHGQPQYGWMVFQWGEKQDTLRCQDNDSDDYDDGGEGDADDDDDEGQLLYSGLGPGGEINGSANLHYFK